MGEKFDPEKGSSFLQYLDANNLYGWAMIQKLPTGGFKWVNDMSKFTSEKIGSLAKHGSKDYLLEVDVKYPEGLHDLHNDLPFMCEKMVINKVEKMVPNLYGKKNCVIHVRALDQALKHGLILEKVHHVVEFDQSAWLAPYIDFNTELRKKAKDEFEKDFFKLMNNSAFGKTMENIRKHKNIKLVTNIELYLKTVMKPNCKSGIFFSSNLMDCEMGKIKVLMNKPVYLCQAICLSKLVMYEFQYNHVITKYVEDLELCYMDTNSLVYHIKTEDSYSDIAGDVKETFDMSRFIQPRPLPISKNKKVIGLMKDELGGEIVTKSIALRLKSYAYRKLDNKEDKRCKGIKKCAVKRMIGFNDYKNCLLNAKSKSIYRSQLLFRNKKFIWLKLTRLPQTKMTISR